MTPFFANFGYSPKWTTSLNDLGDLADIPAVAEKVKALDEVHELCRKNINLANESYAKYYNAKRREGTEFQVGDKVLLSLENVRTRRPAKKLDIRYAGPYRISEKVGSRSFRLELPSSLDIHNVFHISLLRPFAEPIPGQLAEPPGPVEVDDDGARYEVARVVDSRLSRNKKKIEYHVEWVGYEGTDEAATWQPAENLEGAQEEVEKFHLANPTKPSPKDILEPKRKSRSRR
jgi:hypothetical protein